MSITNGPNLGLMVNGLQGEAHYSQFMAFLRGMDGFGMPRVVGYLTNTPPGSPADGDCHIIGAAPTGVWAGQGGKFARYSTVAVAWEFFTPKNGWMVQSSAAREAYRYTGGAWEIYYQEGTWTPAVIDIGAGATYTLSTASGDFTIHGRVVRASFRCVVSSVSGVASSNAQITGLPYAANGAASLHHCFMGRVGLITLSSGYTQVTGFSQSGDTVVRLLQAGSAKALSGLPAAGIVATSELGGLAIYAK